MILTIAVSGLKEEEKDVVLIAFPWVAKGASRKKSEDLI